ncbi:16S rRNA (uracil(1498)-N(3))-methyltransferase [Candidatus Woesearchaeota archaeon]|nr:16S rRNA (uracil(1498)-N(3))-methyltransferase [Candidatus Woesearchaeota archaeon]
MSKTRRFHTKNRIYEGKVRLGGDEIRHIKVLRLKKGAKIEVFNDKGEIGLGTIEKVGETGTDVYIDRVSKVRKSPILTVLACSAPKNRRFDMLIQKATELGVNKIIPISTKRSVVKPGATKLERLKRISIEAAKQSGRNTTPEISSLIAVERLIKNSKEYDLKLILDPKGTKIKEVLTSVKPKKIICLIGPEGGFTDEEIKSAKENGFIPTSLGQRILRVETAGITILSTINYEYEL